MKILQITSCFYPAWAYGGPVTATYYITMELARRGHEVVVFSARYFT